MTTRRQFVRTGAALLGAALTTNATAAEPPRPCGPKPHGEISLEPIIEPDLPIIDAHSHLWVLPESILSANDPMRSYAHYLLEDFLADVKTGHNVRATVYMEADPQRPMWRRTGPDEMKPVGEIEFANGVAAMAASGIFGDVQACAAIVGFTELERGEAAVERILTAHVQAGGGRYRGIREATFVSRVPHGYLDKQFRSGFRCLHKMGLSFDAMVATPGEIPEVMDLARAFPDTQIILDHCGAQKDFSSWRDNVRGLARCPNVAVKLGGLGMMEFKPEGVLPPFKSEQLVPIWKPYIETCIEAFSATRCMFESNFPMDSATCSYPVLWNTFKRLSAGASAGEKSALFSGTAAKVYRLNV